MARRDAAVSVVKNAALFEVAHGATADVVLAHLVDADRGHHPRLHAKRFDGVLHGERVHHGGEHAHVIAGHAVHSGARKTRSAEDVAAADDHGHVHTHFDELLQLERDALDDARIDAVVTLAHQGFAGELHEDAFVRKC